jgi:two-component system chemotaxis sensor kinase CheA
VGRWNEAILSTFRRESDERLERVDALLVDLEKDPSNADVFTEVSREIHTLKGSAKMLGVDPMAELAHKVEDVLGALGTDAIAASSEVFSAVLRAIDVMRELVDAFATDESADRDVADLCTALAAIARGDAPADESPAGTTAAEAPAPPTTATGEDRPSEPPAPRPPSAAEQPPTRTAPSSVTDAQPAPPRRPAPSAPPRPAPTSPKAPLTSFGATPTAARTAAGTQMVQRLDTVRTDIRKLDTIMNLVGEAAISHIKSETYLRKTASFVRQCEGAQKLAQAVREELLAARDALEPAKSERLATLSGQLAGALKELRGDLRDFRVRFDTDALEDKLLLDSLQQEVAEIRMLPVSTIFARFPRAARDLAQERGKQVEVEIAGEETRLDQKVLENIEAPLIHILRNAVDHGIEPPTERSRLGKPPRGTIRLCAFREGGRIAIEVSDDGRGLDPAKLRETAVHRGILTAAEAEAVSDREAPYLICATGFSTAPAVTDVSGRGVGMDVVRKMVEESKGELSIDSTLGGGTTIKISLPLTLAVTQVLMVEVGNQVFCIPTLSIEMVRMIDPAEVQLVADKPVVKVGRRSVPLVRLAEVLCLDGAAPPPPGSKVPAVFLSHARQRIAFAVNRLIAEQQIVIKSFGRILRNVPNVAGATIFGSGEVGIILHTPDLVKHGLGLAGKTVPIALPGASTDAAAGPLPILVVDDSLATREMERDILEAAGYETDTAIHGQDGLEKSRRKSYGLFVVDLQMPVLDGFGLVTALRASEQYARTPVVIVSSLSSDADKRRGLEVGADAYLVKSEFSQDLLLEMVARFLGEAPGGPARR